MRLRVSPRSPNTRVVVLPPTGAAFSVLLGALESNGDGAHLWLDPGRNRVTVRNHGGLETVCRKCGGRMRVLEVAGTADDIARGRGGLLGAPLSCGTFQNSTTEAVRGCPSRFITQPASMDCGPPGTRPAGKIPA